MNMKVTIERITDLISIIVPVYNAESVLPRCLDGLIHQTYATIEIILVNDGSSDSSLSVCEEYSAKYPYIKVISKENGGPASARNAGLKAAKGEYILFVDSDDEVEKDICEKLFKSIKSNGANCAICGHYIKNEDSSLISVSKIQDAKTISGRAALHNMYCSSGNKGLSLVELWGRLFHYSMWTDIWLEDGLYYEDLEIMPRLYFECEKINEIPYVGYHYYVYEESESHGKGTDDKRVWDSIAIREEHVHFFDEKGDKDVSDAIIDKLLDLIVTSGRNGWIPNDKSEYVLSIFKKYWKRYRKTATMSLRLKLRYGLFALGGKSSFKAYKG